MFSGDGSRAYTQLLGQLAAGLHRTSEGGSASLSV